MRTALALVFTAASIWGQAETYQLQPAAGARFALTVEKTGLWSGRKHVFEFQSYRGLLRFDRSAPERSQVEFEIDAGSAVCNDAWVSEKDRKKVLDYMFHEMLDIERHPHLSFRSTSVAPAGGNAFDVAGVLTVRGIERPARVTVTLETADGNLVAVAGRSVIRMKDYGLKPPTAVLGAIGTKNEMTVEFRLLPKAQS